LCKPAWDNATQTATTSVTVEATKDGIADGDKHMFLTFEPIQAYGSGAYLAVFNNYTLPPVNVSTF
jgi:hypothetical protein